MEKLKKLNITILGKSYTISTDEDENTINDAAKLVDTLMKGIVSKTLLKDNYRVAILVALQLATDLEKNKNELNMWQTKTKSLDVLLENDT